MAVINSNDTCAMGIISQSKPTKLKMSDLNYFGREEGQDSDANSVYIFIKRDTALQPIEVERIIYGQLLYLVALRENPKFITTIVEDEQDYPILFKEAITNDWTAIKSIQSEFLTTELCVIAVTQNWQALQFVPARLCNANIVKIAHLQNEEALHYIHWDTHGIEGVRERCDCDAYVEDLISSKGELFLHLNTHDEELLKLALDQNGLLLGLLSEDQLKEITEDTTYIIAVSQNGLALEFVPVDHMTDEICEAALKQNGMALQFVPINFRNKKVIDIAIKQNPRAKYLLR